MACPGSIAAQAAVTEKDEGNKASKEGTVAHSLLQTCIVFGFDPQRFLGDFIDGPNMPAVAQHMIDGVRHAIEYVAEYLDFYGHDKVEVLPERRVSIGPMIGVSAEECNGTSDLLLRHRDMSRLNVIDYKHGVMPVGAKDNPQLFLYTAGCVQELGKYKEYRNTIIQPRAPKKRPVEEHDYKHGKLTIFMQKAGRAAQAALLPNAPRVAGDHCTFCKAKANCQTYRRRVRQTATNDFDEIPDPETIPDDQLDQILDEAQQLKQWIKAIELRALRLAVSGHQFKGYELGWSARQRVFQHPEEVVEWCRKKNLIVDEYMPRQLLSPKQLEDVLKKHKLYPAKKRGSAEQPESPLAHLVGYTVPKPKLKPRGADAGNDFDDLDDE
jgi:hypothetical protein